MLAVMLATNDGPEKHYTKCNEQIQCKDLTTEHVIRGYFNLVGHVQWGHGSLEEYL